MEYWLGQRGSVLLEANAGGVALCIEMETEPCEEFDPAAKPTKPEVEEAITEPADGDTHTELPCGSAEEGQELHGEEQAEAESCAGESQSSDIRKPSDPEECGDTACKELQKTNSWKTVRFQEPSMDDDVLEIDSSAESLFPEYVTEEWTSSTFEELFGADDWLDITGEEINSIKVYLYNPNHSF